LTIQKALLDVTERRQGQLAHRQEKGDIAQFDVIDNERSVLQRQALVVQAERQLQQASFELSLFYRADTGEPRIPSSTLLPTDLPAFSPHDLYSFEEELQKAYLARPDLIRLKQQREQNALEIKLADNQLLPRLDIQMAAAQDLGPQESKLDEFELRGGIKLEVPIFNRVAMGRQQSLQAKDKELGFLIAFLQDRIRADLKDVLTAIKLSRERVGVLTNEYQTAQRVEEGERERYSHGDSNLIFVNLREQTSADAAIRVVDAKLDYNKAKASLAAILGKDS
jgi:outer membrane protein TolC